MEHTTGNVQHNGGLPDSARAGTRTPTLRALPLRLRS